MEDLVSPFFFVSFSILIPFYFLFIQGPIGDLKCLSCIAHGAVTPYRFLGKLSDILHLNNKNNQLER